MKAEHFTFTPINSDAKESLLQWWARMIRSFTIKSLCDQEQGEVRRMHFMVLYGNCKSNTAAAMLEEWPFVKYEQPGRLAIEKVATAALAFRSAEEKPNRLLFTKFGWPGLALHKKILLASERALTSCERDPHVAVNWPTGALICPEGLFSLEPPSQIVCSHAQDFRSTDEVTASLYDCDAVRGHHGNIATQSPAWVMPHWEKTRMAGQEIEVVENDYGETRRKNAGFLALVKEGCEARVDG